MIRLDFEMEWPRLLVPWRYGHHELTFIECRVSRSHDSCTLTLGLLGCVLWIDWLRRTQRRT